MNCRVEAHCSDLQYCQGQYATLNIGELEDTGYSGSAYILFTDQATDRRTSIDNAGSEPSLVIDTEDFTPIAGHTYMVKVVVTAEGGGIVPAPFKPYTFTDGAFTVSTTSYMEATVRFQKVFNVFAEVGSAQEQWLAIQ